MDYLEVIGLGRPLANPAAPCIAIPTTAGTGSEVTRNAVLASPVHRVKASLRSPSMLPRLAVVDPELTYGLPPAITASTGLDALTQLIEPYVSLRANPMTDQFCVEGMRRAAPPCRAFGRTAAIARPAATWPGPACSAEWRWPMPALGAVHGFAAPLGGMFPAPHGAVCAALLPHAMEVNVRALRARAPEKLTRYDEVARLITGRPHAIAAGWCRLDRDLVPKAGDSAAAHLWRRRERSPRPGGKGRARQQHEGQSDRPDREELREIISLAL